MDSPHWVVKNIGWRIFNIIGHADLVSTPSDEKSARFSWESSISQPPISQERRMPTVPENRFKGNYGASVVMPHLK
jgi:hypothetical protein